MKVYNDIQELIGNTPLLRLKAFETKPEVEIYAKLELFNPGGSVKDRIGVSMIKDAEARGTLKAGGTIIEATAGNTGIGVALAALGKGYRVIFTVPEKFSIEKITLMKALGAEVIQTPKADGMTGAIELAEKMREEIEGAISLKQFENEENPKVHYSETGREIYEALGGEVDVFIAGAGSGGTVSGVSRYLKDQNSHIKTYVADPLGSTMGGGESGCYEIEGIGNHFVPNTMDVSVIDDFITVTDEEAFSLIKEIALRTGLFVGSSSGAALSAALKVASTLEKGKIVVVFPDRGERYFSKGIFDEVDSAV